MFLSLLCLAACSTTTRTVRSEQLEHHDQRIIQRDTLRLLRTLHDSIYVRDSIYLQGQTLVKERWRTQWRTRIDTIYKLRHDTIVQRHERVQRDQETKHTTSWFDRFAPLALLSLLVVLGFLVLLKKLFP